MSSFTLIGHALQSVIKLKPLLHMALCIVLLYSVQHWYANLGQNTLIHKMINGFLNSPHPNFIPRSEQSQQQSSASFDIFSVHYFSRSYSIRLRRVCLDICYNWQVHIICYWQQCSEISSGHWLRDNDDGSMSMLSPAFTFILLLIYRCRGQWNTSMHVCPPLPSLGTTEGGISWISWWSWTLQYPGWLSLVRLLLKWSQECRNSENFSKPRGEE